MPIYEDKLLEQVLGGLPMFGDGSDGNVTISADTTLANGQSYKQYNNLTINSGVSLSSSSSLLVVKVKGTLTVNGFLHMDGKGPSGGLRATAQGPGASGTSPNILLSHVDASGIGRYLQSGGESGTTSNGYGGKKGKANKILFDVLRNLSATKLSAGTFIQGGSGGGSPYNPSTCNSYIEPGTQTLGGEGAGGAGVAYHCYGQLGQHGGAGGGCLIVHAANVVIGVSGRISADGHAPGGTTGANPGNYTGGAGGGQGGFCLLIYRTLSNAGSNNIRANGGQGGWNPAYNSSYGGAGGTGYMNTEPTDGADGIIDPANSGGGGGGAGGCCIGRQVSI